MLRVLHYIGLTAIAVAVTGCVPAAEYAGLKVRSDQLAEQLAHSQSEINEANARADQANKQLAMQSNGNASRDAYVNSLSSEKDKLQAENDRLNGLYTNAVGQLASQTSGPALPGPLNNELQTFASDYPDLIEFDSGRGIVKFKSDVTFETGSALVEAKAKDIITRFSSILNSSGADGYDLLIAGHTDNKPVTSDKAIKQGNFDNWYLSAHRAIAVSREMILDGVSAHRIGVVGYGSERPMLPNTSADNMRQNRRVEVLIVPQAAGRTSVASSTPTVHPRRTRPTVTPGAGTAEPAGSHADPEVITK